MTVQNWIDVLQDLGILVVAVGGIVTARAVRDMQRPRQALSKTRWARFKHWWFRATIPWWAVPPPGTSWRRGEK